MFAQCLTILTFLALYEATAVIHKRIAECEGVYDCAASIPGFTNGEVGMWWDVFYEDAFNLYCQNHSQVQSCFVNTIRNCQNVTIKELSTNQGLLLTYLCSYQGQAGFNSLKNSPCYTNFETLRLAMNMSKVCLETFNNKARKVKQAAHDSGINPPQNTLCSFVSEAINCTINEASSRCGNIFKPLFWEYWRTAAIILFAQFGCNI